MRQVALGILITMISGLVLAGFGAYSELKSNQSAIIKDVENNKDQIKEVKSDIVKRLDRIEYKVDRINAPKNK
jgi:hypothetical protein